MCAYEVMLFSEADKAVGQAMLPTERDALAFAGAELRAGHGGAYNAAIWGAHPATFYCLYVNALGEVFSVSDPVILTREQAGQLRRRALA